MTKSAQVIYEELIERLKNKDIIPLDSLVRISNLILTFSGNFDYEAHEEAVRSLGYPLESKPNAISIRLAKLINKQSE